MLGENTEVFFELTMYLNIMYMLGASFELLEMEKAIAPN